MGSTGAFCNIFDPQLAIIGLDIGLENLFWSSFEWPLKTGFAAVQRADNIHRKRHNYRSQTSGTIRKGH